MVHGLLHLSFLHITGFDAETCGPWNEPLSTPLNSLWPGDTIGRHKSGSTLDQVMACCLMALSHYLNQC